MLCGGLIAAPSARRAAQSHDQLPQRFTATAINMGTPGPATVNRLDIVVDRWSPQAQHQRLIGVLFEKGPEKLLDTLQDLPRVGSIKTPDSLAYDLHYAQVTPLPEGGERIVLATDRYIRFWEAARSGRTLDYPFTVIEMRIDREGRGEGKMSIATKITADKRSNSVILENYGTQPVRLANVRRDDS